MRAYVRCVFQVFKYLLLLKLICPNHPIMMSKDPKLLGIGIYIDHECLSALLQKIVSLMCVSVSYFRLNNINQ